MTNEEKAREIGEFFDTTYLAALEMAEWKDQQFKEYLEKKIYDIEHGPDTDFEGQMMEDDEIYMLKEIINELFGGE